MHKKTLLILGGILTGASLFAALFLVLNSTCVKADPSAARPAELLDEELRRPTARQVTIVQPASGDILTATHQPTYIVGINVDIVMLETVSVSVDHGVVYWEATQALVGPYDYVYEWDLPDEDYEEYVIVARARYSAGERRVVSGTATVHVDTYPPHGRVITVPAHVETTGFTVSWSATDGSGKITYDVDYRRDDEVAWTHWVSDGPETSQLFTAALDGGHSYTFRMRARDRGGNVSDWIDETVQVGGLQVYLPLTVRHWVWWYAYDPYEPNDTPGQAWGPLQPGTDYEAYVWNETDSDDYYYFIPVTPANAAIALTRIPDGTDYDLYVYYYDSKDEVYVQVGASNNTGTSDELVTLTPVPLRTYYVRVYRYPEAGFSSEQAYHLELTYELGD